LLVNITSFSRSGTFDRLILSEDGTTCIGAITKDGTEYLADRVILAAGAWSPALIDLEDQCCSKVMLTNTPIDADADGSFSKQAWVWAHLQLTPEEIKDYAGCPVVYNEDIGFFFEPDE